MLELLEKCGCVYCDGACEIQDEYSEEGHPCATCFEEHTYFDKKQGAFYPIRKGEDNE
jgi:hypothetical protein